LNSAGVIQTTENQLLTIGGDTTGNIYLNGNVGIGTATPGYKLDVYGGDFQVTNTGETARVRLNTTGGAVSREWMFFASSVDGGFGIYDVTGSQRRMTILTSGNVGIGDSSPTSLFTVGSGDLFQIDSSGRIVAIDNVAHTIDDVSGDLTLTSNSGEVDIADDLAVNGATSADITSTTATATLFNSTPTTVSIGGVATTLNYGAGGALGRAINIGTGTGIDTISIGTGATGADVINIGSSNAGNLTVASGTTFDLDAATVNIDGSTAINIGTTADKPIDVDADTFDLDASGALTLTGAANSTIDFPNFDVATTGNITTAGDLAVNGGDITSTATTFNFDIGDTGTLNFRDGTNTLVAISDQGTTGRLAVSDSLQVGSISTLAYSRFGTALQQQDKIV